LRLKNRIFRRRKADTKGRDKRGAASSLERMAARPHCGPEPVVVISLCKQTFNIARLTFAAPNA
jgi:hypothetical protein